MGRAQPGTPAGLKVALADDDREELPGTSQIVAVDREGNAVSMTTSIEYYFGSRLMVRGFLLNNQLTDFNFEPLAEGRLTGEAIAPGKRPRSSMAPFIVTDAKTGRLEQVLGSPGGSLIIGYVAKALVATLDWKLDMQSAIDLPNRGSRGGATETEKGTEVLDAVSAALKAMAHVRARHRHDERPGGHPPHGRRLGRRGRSPPRRRRPRPLVPFRIASVQSTLAVRHERKSLRAIRPHHRLRHRHAARFRPVRRRRRPAAHRSEGAGQEEHEGRRRQDGGQRQGRERALHRLALREGGRQGQEVRLLRRPRRAVRVPDRRGPGDQGLGRGRRRHEGRRQAHADHPAGARLRRARRRRRHPARTRR